MQIKPVRRMAPPSYPTRDYLHDHPELLELVPERWRQNGLVLAVLGGVVSLIMASQSQAADRQPANSDASRVAPIFVHGDGRGAFGCDAVTAPVFLTEDEARQVIQNEAKKAGLKFAPDALTLSPATIPVMPKAYFCGSRDPREPATRKGDLTLDGYDQKHGVAYEFVSQGDYSSWESQDSTCISTVYSYDLKGAAEALRKGLMADQHPVRIGIFYEPGEYPSTGQRPGSDATRRRDEEQLRRQVRDFIQWLKAQGVI
jgi:hypothetical protein